MVLASVGVRHVKSCRGSLPTACPGSRRLKPCAAPAYTRPAASVKRSCARKRVIYSQAMDGDAVLQLAHVSRRFALAASVVIAVHDASLELARGEVVAVVGPSGSGKTTLLQIAGAIDRPTEGEVRIDGQDTAGLGRDELATLRRRRLGFVFQTFNLMPGLAALDNVALPLRLDGRPRRESARRARELLEEVGLGQRLAHKPGELSAGEQQRVALARALANAPALVLADEPTGSLDQAAGAVVIERLVRAGHEHGAGVLIVTHDAAVAEAADRVVRMSDGHLDAVVRA